MSLFIAYWFSYEPHSPNYLSLTLLASSISKLSNSMNIGILCLLVTLLLIFVGTNASSPTCDRSCPNSATSFVGKQLPFPFGCSAGCEIPLNCTDAGIFIGEFRIQSINSESIRVNLKSQCNRPLDKLRQLYTKHHAPTAHNAILLRNCTDEQVTSSCMIPSINVEARFQAPTSDCKEVNTSLSCYAESSKNATFLEYESVKRKGCKYLLSSISAEIANNTAAGPSVTLDVEVAEVGWWLPGVCSCDQHADCVNVTTPNETDGYRCNCMKGFVGDGFREGFGCRQVTHECNPARFLSGQCGGKTRIIVLIGGVLFGAFLMTSLGLLCCFIRRQSKLKAVKSTKRLLSEATGNCNFPIYSYKDIEKATNSFSDKQRLGTGAYGTVYAGRLQGDEWVAIKKIKNRDDTVEQVMNEIRLISSVSHPNLVRLLGCSIERGQQILVYEFMANGTLCQHLQRERGNGLSWPIRLAIATETAQAIAHLHSSIKPPIYHRDIKSSNILLDCNYNSKVADFGLSRLGMVETSHISTVPQGTPGYLDPQYHQNFHLSDKSDVYSFGVVLVEIITGRKAVDFSRPQNEVNLASLATEKIGEGRLNEIIDPFLEPFQDEWTAFSIHKVAELAFRCLTFHREARPSMMEVKAELEEIKLSRWPASEGESSFGSTSSVTEKPLNTSKSQSERDVLEVKTSTIDSSSFISTEKLKENSPVSVQESWLSEKSSSPSSNSLLSNAV